MIALFSITIGIMNHLCIPFHLTLLVNIFLIENDVINTNLVLRVITKSRWNKRGNFWREKFREKIFLL